MRPMNIQIIKNGDMEQNIVSGPTDLVPMWGYAIQGVFTGTPAGTIKLQASCDAPPQNQFGGPVPTNWSDISGSSQAISGAGDWLPNVVSVYYNWVRVVFTPTTPSSNPGTLNVRINCKGI